MLRNQYENSTSNTITTLLEIEEAEWRSWGGGGGGDWKAGGNAPIERDVLLTVADHVLE